MTHHLFKVVRTSFSYFTVLCSMQWARPTAAQKLLLMTTVTSNWFAFISLFMTSELRVMMIDDYDDSVKSIYLNILGAISIHEEKKRSKNTSILWICCNSFLILFSYIENLHGRYKVLYNEIREYLLINEYY